MKSTLGRDTAPWFYQPDPSPLDDNQEEFPLLNLVTIPDHLKRTIIKHSPVKAGIQR